MVCDRRVREEGPQLSTLFDFETTVELIRNWTKNVIGFLICKWVIDMSPFVKRDKKIKYVLF